MKNLKAVKLSNQEMQKVSGGGDNEFVRTNVEKPIFRQEFGQKTKKKR